MKKRKIAFFVNIVSICLSICAIAIGVYSIKNATLNVNGAIGFTAHNCNVDIATTMYGDSAASDSSTAESVASGVIRTESNAKKYDAINVNGGTETLNLGTLYFSDLTENGKINPITLSFQITNKSAYFYIDVNVNQSCINNERISIYAPNNGETLAPRASMTLTIQFQLKQGGSSLENNIDFTDAALLNFEKSQAPAYLATDWKSKITGISSVTSISFVKEIDESIKSNSSYTQIKVGAVNATSEQSDLTNNKNVTDIVAYYNSTNKEVIIYSPARVYAPQNCKEMFNFFENLTNVNFSNLDTSNVTNMSGMFHYCYEIASIDVSNFDLSKVTNMSEMFASCNKLTSLDASNFDTSKVTNMSNMFYLCYALTSLDLGNLDTSNVTQMDGMFIDCYTLNCLNVYSFDTSKVTSMASMFLGCERLTSLDLSNFDTSNVTNMGSMFQSCSKLTSIKATSGKWVIDSSCATTDMFNGCGCSEVTLV